MQYSEIKRTVCSDNSEHTVLYIPKMHYSIRARAFFPHTGGFQQILPFVESLLILLPEIQILHELRCTVSSPFVNFCMFIQCMHGQQKLYEILHETHPV